jgi:hypothetical protein
MVIVWCRREIQTDLRHTFEGVVREEREQFPFSVEFVGGADEEKRERTIWVLGGGENGLVEEGFREEIRVSNESMPGFGYAPESDQGLWWQLREYFHHQVLRQKG